MKNLLLLTGLSAFSFAALAEVPIPTVIEDALICSISPNGNYAVSQGTGGMRIFNLSTGEEYTQLGETEDGEFYVGNGNCVSNNGLVVATTPESPDPLYWKEGEWYKLPVPSYAVTSYAQAVNSDGTRMCGNIRINGMGNDEDMLMVAPCIWTEDGDGFGMPVLLPHPEFDYSDRIPQYITAIDISGDGKIVVGQIRDAQGILNYPILYRENENGEWSYEVIHEELINPDKLEVIPFPGEGPVMPQFESFMTQDEIDAYIEAYNEYVESGGQIPCPEYWNFMTYEEILAYNKAADEYNEKAMAYNEKFEAWADFITGVALSSPGYAFNQVRISADGKTVGCTVQVEGEIDPMTGFPTVENSVWLFDLTSDKITRYGKNGDLNIHYVADNGIGIGTTSAGTISNSYILKDGETIDILTWMNSKAPEYASWMNDNMFFPYQEMVYNEETGNYDLVYGEDLMTGRATSTPDFSVVSLSVQNVWDGIDDGLACIFDMNIGSAVENVSPVSEENRIYDLSGRKLKNATAPGIYIINGEKKVVR